MMLPEELPPSKVESFSITRSATALTVVSSEVLLLPGTGSAVADDAVAVLVITVPSATDGSTTPSITTVTESPRLRPPVKLQVTVFGSGLCTQVPLPTVIVALVKATSAGRASSRLTL